MENLDVIFDAYGHPGFSSSNRDRCCLYRDVIGVHSAQASMDQIQNAFLTKRRNLLDLLEHTQQQHRLGSEAPRATEPFDQIERQLDGLVLAFRILSDESLRAEYDQYYCRVPQPSIEDDTGKEDDYENGGLVIIKLDGNSNYHSQTLFDDAREVPGTDTTTNQVRVTKGYDVDLHKHRAQTLSDDHVHWSDTSTLNTSYSSQPPLPELAAEQSVGSSSGKNPPISSKDIPHTPLYSRVRRGRYYHRHLTPSPPSSSRTARTTASTPTSSADMSHSIITIHETDTEGDYAHHQYSPPPVQRSACSALGGSDSEEMQKSGSEDRSFNQQTRTKTSFPKDSDSHKLSRSSKVKQSQRVLDTTMSTTASADDDDGVSTLHEDHNPSNTNHEDEDDATWDDGTLTFMNTVDQSTVVSTYDGNKSFLDHVHDEVVGALEDTARSLEDVFHVFTLREEDIKAVMKRIDKAKVDLGETFL